MKADSHVKSATNNLHATWDELTILYSFFDGQICRLSHTDSTKHDYKNHSTSKDTSKICKAR